MSSAPAPSRTRWVFEEEDALVKGVAKHGKGRWMRILTDPEFSDILKLRTNVNLKDKWRSIGEHHPQGPPKPSDKERIAALNERDSGSDLESSPEPERLPKSRFDVPLSAFKEILQQEVLQQNQEEAVEEDEVGELPHDVFELSIEDAKKHLAKLNANLDDVAQKKASLKLTADRKGATWLNSAQYKEAFSIVNQAELNFIAARELLQKRIEIGLTPKSPPTKKKSKDSSHQKKTKKHREKRTKSSSPERSSKRASRKRAKGNVEPEPNTRERTTRSRMSSSNK